MDVLSDLVASMNKEEIQAYKLFTLRKNAGQKRKDVLLFDAIKKGGNEYQENKTAELLYGVGSKNSFYRLKHRLTNNLLKSLSVHHFDDNDVSFIHHLLGLSNLFYKKRSFKLMLQCLKKAEFKALEIEQYELLEIVYSDFIKASQEIITIDPQEYIDKRLVNADRLGKLRTLEDAISVLNYRLKTTQNFISKKMGIVSYLEDLVSELVQDKSLLTLKFKTRVFRAVSQVLLSKKDYVSLEKYLVETYDQFLKEKLFFKTNHETKLQMLTYLVNTLFKNNKIKDSLKWANDLKVAMEEYKGALKSKYQFYYYNALVNNYNVIDKDKSIAILEDIKASKWMKTDPYLGIFVYINLALNWFDKCNYKKSLRNFQVLKLQEHYENTASSLKFKWAIGALIVRFKLNDQAKFELKLIELLADYKEEVNTPENKRDLEFINLLRDLNKKRVLIDKSLKFRLNAFCLVEGNDEELINYTSWLKTLV